MMNSLYINQVNVQLDIWLRLARNKNLVSPYQNGRNSIRYKINKQISRKAGYGPISVWEDITSAENFIEKYKIQNARIYEVE